MFPDLQGRNSAGLQLLAGWAFEGFCTYGQLIGTSQCLFQIIRYEIRSDCPSVDPLYTDCKIAEPGSRTAEPPLAPEVAVNLSLEVDFSPREPGELDGCSGHGLLA
jgi:hypothetical protein